MTEPIVSQQNNSTGRPEYSEEQYRTWLEDMAPFLKVGYSLYFAMDKALLLRHKDSIYKKYRLKDWFSEKIDAYRSYPGEIVNSIFARVIMQVDEKIKQGQEISTEEWKNLRFFAEKHRSSQPFFVSRHEVAKADPDIAGILDLLEADDEPDRYNDLAEMAKRELERQQASA